MSSLLSVGFFNKGETSAGLKCVGKHPSESDKLTIEAASDLVTLGYAGYVCSSFGSRCVCLDTVPLEIPYSLILLCSNIVKNKKTHFIIHMVAQQGTIGAIHHYLVMTCCEMVSHNVDVFCPHITYWMSTEGYRIVLLQSWEHIQTGKGLLWTERRIQNIYISDLQMPW